jgi:enolase
VLAKRAAKSSTAVHGNPTVEVDVLLEDGSFGPCGGSLRRIDRRHEAVELRDGDKSKYLGKGVLKAVEAVNGEICRSCRRHGCRGPGRDRPRDDRARRHPNKGKLGANAILGVSLAWPRRRRMRAACRSIAMSAGAKAHVLPVPMMNIINGGAHADNPIDFQEFMIMPVGADSFADALRIGAEIFHTLKKGLHDKGPATTPSATRAASRPTCRPPDRRARLHLASIEKAGYKPGDDVMLALDCASTEFFKNGKYEMVGEGKS